MDTSSLLFWISWFIGGPLVLYAIGVSIICTIAFRFVQFRKFFEGFSVIFSPAKTTGKGDMTPLQAFINTLSTNLGNGTVMGSATAVITGGPGAAVWVMLIGFLLMAVRFVEVYASTWYGARAPKGTTLGGPMLYLRQVAGGRVLSFLYALSCCFFGLIVGNALQAHSISYSIATTWGVNPYITAVGMGLFVCFVLFGGAKRIVAISDAIVPVKVMVFFGAAIVLIGYHGGMLVPALRLMFQEAFSPSAMIGGMVGFTIMQAVQSGMNLSLTSTESGLGTAGILFGFTGSTDPIRSGLMGMISTFVSSLVCFTVVLCLVISGVWSSGLQSSALVISAFGTVFGSWAGWIISFLSVSFGMGVLVAYAYITRAAWLSLTGGRLEYLFMLFYCAASFVGAIVDVNKIWVAVAIINGILLTINLSGLLLLTPRLSRTFAELERKEG